MLILFIKACYTASKYEAAMRQSLVVSFHLLSRYEMNCSIVVTKIIWHIYYLTLNSRLICTFLHYYKAFSCMFLSGSKSRLLALSYPVYSLFYRYGVLPCILYSLYSSYGIRMSLAHSLPPEGVVLTLRKHGGRYHSKQGEHTRIPAH